MALLCLSYLTVMTSMINKNRYLSMGKKQEENKYRGVEALVLLLFMNSPSHTA